MLELRNNLAEMVAGLDEHRPYSFSRFGDGEWASIWGVEGCNVDGHEYFPELSRDLRQAVLDEGPYLYGLQPRVAREFTYAIDKVAGSHFPWMGGDVFHKASIKGQLHPLIQALRRKSTVLVGPERLMDVDDLSFLQTLGQIEVPSANCYKAKDDILEAMQDCATPGVLFAISASMLSNVLIHEMFESIGKSCWMIDFGSLWEPYAGFHNRAYHRHLQKHTMWKNLWNK